MNQKSLDKKKGKELDWEKEFNNDCWDTKDGVMTVTYLMKGGNKVGRLTERVTKEMIKSYVKIRLTQQRTELLEGIDTKWKNKIKKVKEQIFGSDKTWNKTLNEISTFRPDLAEQFNIIYMRFTNLLNKKDE